MKVLLIGGTSHTGKSVLGERLAAELGWEHLSTDKLARHPGRPWSSEGSEVPAFVAQHYLSLSTAALIDDVLNHYEHNVWPIAAAIVKSRLNNPYEHSLVLEGSAILPDLVQASQSGRVGRVWLTAGDQEITERIRTSSGFNSRTESGRTLINAFIARALAFNREVLAQADKQRLQTLDATSPDLFDQLVALAKGGPP